MNETSRKTYVTLTLAKCVCVTMCVYVMKAFEHRLHVGMHRRVTRGVNFAPGATWESSFFIISIILITFEFALFFLLLSLLTRTVSLAEKFVLQIFSGVLKFSREFPRGPLGDLAKIFPNEKFEFYFRRQKDLILKVARLRGKNLVSLQKFLASSNFSIYLWMCMKWCKYLYIFLIHSFTKNNQWLIYRRLLWRKALFAELDEN